MSSNSNTDFKIKNFGTTYYYPNESLSEGLQEVIIFCENNNKKGIPNGSIFIYKNRKYIPEILKSDVGCGITAFKTEKIEINKSNIKKILKAVDDIGVHIGQGNHFLDITSADDSDKIYFFLHSDFNNTNFLPSTFEEACELENHSREKRKEVLGKLVTTLGIENEYYNNWTHNTVRKQNDKHIYRKGSINIEDSNGCGLLALNPIDGVLLYKGDLSTLHHSMQHGTGRKGSKVEFLSMIKKETFGIARGYIIPESSENEEVHQLIENTYNTTDRFFDQFGNHISKDGILHLKTRLHLKTKI